jgi:hypothetical protein
MRPTRLAALVFLVASVSQVAFAQTQLPLREGNWELTVQVEMPGMPMKMPDVKDTRCLTRDMLKDPAAAVPSASPGSNNDCKVSDYQTTGNKATWKMVCTVPMPISGSGEITYAGDTYTGSITVSMGGTPAVMNFSGKRLGDCPPAPPK